MQNTFFYVTIVKSRGKCNRTPCFLFLNQKKAGMNAIFIPAPIFFVKILLNLHLQIYPLPHH